MNDVFYMFLCIITVVYLCICFATDIKERVIYSFPCIPLASVWWVSAIRLSNQSIYMYGIAIGHIFVFFLLKMFPIWADGDNDLFFLSSAIFANAYSLGTRNLPASVATELLYLVFSMGFSMFVGFLEAKRRHTKLLRNSSVALAPGFCVTCVLLLICIVKMRWFVWTI